MEIWWGGEAMGGRGMRALGTVACEWPVKVWSRAAGNGAIK